MGELKIVGFSSKKECELYYYKKESVAGYMDHLSTRYYLNFFSEGEYCEAENIGDRVYFYLSSGEYNHKYNDQHYYLHSTDGTLTEFGEKWEKDKKNKAIVLKFIILVIFILIILGYFFG